VCNSAGDGSNEATDGLKEPSSPSRSRSVRTKTNAVNSPAVKEGWLLSEEQGARKRGKASSSGPALSPTSTDDPVAISSIKTMSSTRKLLPEVQGSRKRGRALISAPNPSPTTADDPISISDTEDDASPQALSSDLQQSLQSATSVTRSAGEKCAGKRERSSTRVSSSTCVSLESCSAKQGRHQESKLLAARDLPRMSMVMTPFGPGIFLRLREAYAVCISRKRFRLENNIPAISHIFVAFVSRLAPF